MLVMRVYLFSQSYSLFTPYPCVLWTYSTGLLDEATGEVEQIAASIISVAPHRESPCSVVNSPEGPNIPKSGVLNNTWKDSILTGVL